MNTTARHDLPDDPSDLARLAYLLDFASTDAMEAQCAETMQQNRALFEQIMDQYASESV